MEDKLYERDWRFILDSVLRINSVESVEVLEREALECLIALIPCTQGTFFIASHEDDGIFYRRPVWIGAEAKFMSDFIEGDYRYNSYFSGMTLIPRTETFRDSDILPAEYREKSLLYKEIYEPQGIYYPLRSYLVYKGKLIANISMFNSRDRGDFDNRALAILDSIAPHIALRLGKLLENESSKQADDRTAADRLMDDRGLTAREKEITKLVVEGLDDAEIADALFIANSTLKKHLYNAYRKLDVNNKAQLCILLSSAK